MYILWWICWRHYVFVTVWVLINRIDQSDRHLGSINQVLALVHWSEPHICATSIEWQEAIHRPCCLHHLGPPERGGEGCPWWMLGPSAFTRDRRSVVPVLDLCNPVTCSKNVVMWPVMCNVGTVGISNLDLGWQWINQRTGLKSNYRIRVLLRLVSGVPSW